MLKRLTSADINKEKWDDCIESSHEAIFYALSCFLDSSPYNWSAIVDEQIDDEGDTYYETVFPYQHIKKFGFSIIIQDPFLHELGIFSRNPLIDKNIFELIELAFSNFAYVSHYIFNSKNTISQLKTVPSYHLPLNTPYETLFKNYHSKRKYELRNATAAQLNIRKSNNIELHIDLFRQHVASKIYGIEEYQYHQLITLYNQFHQKGFVQIYEVLTNDNEVVTSGMFITHQQKITYFFAATSPTGRKLSSSVFLLDYIIKKYSSSNYTLDFEGGDTSNLATFYKRFGAHKKEIPIYSKNQLPFLIKWVQKVRMILVSKK